MKPETVLTTRRLATRSVVGKNRCIFNNSEKLVLDWLHSWFIKFYTKPSISHVVITNTIGIRSNFFIFIFTFQD